MKKDRNKSEIYDIVQWFKVLLAIAGIMILILVYFFVEPNPESKLITLLLTVLPDGIMILIAIPIIYLLFYRRGLSESQLETNIDAQELAQYIAENLSNPKSTKSTQQLIAFYETFRLIEWNTLLTNAQSHIDIVVYYFDVWVNVNYENLVLFFKKPRTTIRVFVPNPYDEFNSITLQNLFPENNLETLREKINQTKYRLAEALKEAGGDSSRLEFYYISRPLNYSVQCIDNKILVMSVFEMFRKTKVDSPAIIVDLNKSQHLADYWDKELKGLLTISKKDAKP